MQAHALVTGLYLCQSYYMIRLQFLIPGMLFSPNRHFTPCTFRDQQFLSVSILALKYLQIQVGTE